MVRLARRPSDGCAGGSAVIGMRPGIEAVIHYRRRATCQTRKMQRSLRDGVGVCRCSSQRRSSRARTDRPASVNAFAGRRSKSSTRSELATTRPAGAQSSAMPVRQVPSQAIVASSTPLVAASVDISIVIAVIGPEDDMTIAARAGPTLIEVHSNTATNASSTTRSRRLLRARTGMLRKVPEAASDQRIAPVQSPGDPVTSNDWVPPGGT